MGIKDEEEMKERPQADTSAVEKLLAEIPSEGEATDKGIQDGPAASPAEKPKTEAAPSPDGAKSDDKKEEASDKGQADDEKLPFHRHPRWKAMREELKKRDIALEELKQSIESLKQTKDKSEEPRTIPTEFVELFGDNPEHWEKFRKLTTSQAESIVSDRLRQMEEKQSKAANESTRWNQWVDEQMASLSEETGLSLEDPDSSERNEILKVALEYSPTDAQGNVDLKKSYELWKALKAVPKKAEEKKKVAALTVDDKAHGSQPEKVVGFHELKGKNWRDYIPN